MQTVFVILSGIITVVAAIPYMVQIVRGKTKPRIVSWFTWMLISGIACAASFSDGQIGAGVLMACATLEVGMIVVLGFKHGDRHFERIDIICQLGALTGLALWFMFSSPAIAVIAAITIDLVGCIPTFKHSWQKPHEETWITFALSGVGGACTLLATRDWRITAVAYALYIVVINLVTAGVILGSPHRRLKGGPAELREL